MSVACAEDEVVMKAVEEARSKGIVNAILVGNEDKIKAVPVQGVAPTYAAIADGSYPGSRPLFIYIKKAHVGVVPGLAEYVAEFLKGAGDGGYLNAKGLIVSPKAIADLAASNGKAMTALNGAELK